MTYTTKKYYEADKQYYKDKAKKRRAEIKSLVDQIKNVPCMDCGNSYPSYVMDFDHRGDKLDNVAVLVQRGVSLARLMAEIEKCDIVCANCHRIRTWSKYIKEG